MTDQVECPEGQNCAGKGYCTHSQTHIAFVPWTPNDNDKLCTEGHYCSLVQKQVACVAGVKDA